MAYSITAHTRARAKALGVIVKPSKLKGKKIDVFNKQGDKLASVGAIGYGDYGTFIRTKGLEFAKKRRKAYRDRHAKENNKEKFPRGYYAYQLLW